jgi:hypothetical protein
MGLDPGTILNGFAHPFRKRGHIPVAVVILKYLSAIFGYHPGYVDIEHLTGLVVHLMVPTGGQRAAVDQNRINSIRIINLLWLCPHGPFDRLYSFRFWALVSFSCLDQSMAVCCCLCYSSLSDWQAV